MISFRLNGDFEQSLKIFEPIPTWNNLIFAQLFMYIGANNDQI